MKHLLILLLWLTGIAPVQADPQSKSFSSWSVDAGQVEVIYRIASREVTRLPAYQYNPDLSQVLDQHLDQHLQVSHAGASCLVLSATTVATEAGFLRYIGRWQCPADTATITVRNSALFEVAPSHIHFARFQLTGRESFERLYTRHSTEQQIALSGGVEVDDSSSWETRGHEAIVDPRLEESREKENSSIAEAAKAT